MAPSFPLLPPELIAQILRAHFKAFSGGLRVDNYYAPLEVCAIWRQVALADPHSWTNIEVIIDFNQLAQIVSTDAENETVFGDPRPTSPIELVFNEARWKLDKAGIVPVDLKLTFYVWPFNDEYVSFEPVLNDIRDSLHFMFHPHARGRLRSFRECGIGRHMKILLSFFSIILLLPETSPIETITHLELYEPHFPHVITLPNLKCLTIEQDIRWVHSLHNLICPGVTEFNLRGKYTHRRHETTDATYFAPFLDRLPNLQSLSIPAFLSTCALLPQGELRQADTSSQDPMERGDRCYPKLHTLRLEINERGSWTLTPFLEIFPNLRRVVLCFSCQEAGFWFAKGGM